MSILFLSFLFLMGFLYIYLLNSEKLQQVFFWIIALYIFPNVFSILLLSYMILFASNRNTMKYAGHYLFNGHMNQGSKEFSNLPKVTYRARNWQHPDWNPDLFNSKQRLAYIFNPRVLGQKTLNYFKKVNYLKLRQIQFQRNHIKLYICISLC